MPVEKLDDDILQRYFDGELPEAEAEGVRREIATCEETRARLVALERLRVLMGCAAEEASREVAGDDLFAKVRAGIADEASAGSPGALRALPGGGGGAVVEGWKITLPAATALLAAAAVLLFVLGGDSSDVTDTGTGVIVDVEGSVETMIEAPQGSEVVEVDFGENVGTVFAVEGEAGEPIAVVWINDDPEQATQ